MDGHLIDYEALGFCVFTFEGITYNDNNKKQLIGMPNWKNINKMNYKNYCYNHHKGLAIITGKLSGVTGIDFDVKDGKCAYDEVMEKYPELKKCKTIKTQSGGYHVYCKYDETINTTTNAFNEFSNIDIRNDNAILFAPPSKVIKNRVVIGAYEDMGGDILPFPDDLKMKLKQFTNVKAPEPKPVAPEPKPKQTPKQTPKQIIVEDIETDDETDNETELTKEQELLYMVRMSDKKDRKTWMRVCSCLKNNGLTNKDWLQFCKLNGLHMDPEKENLFRNIGTFDNFGFYYIQSLAKHTNPEKYKQWVKKWNIYNITHSQALNSYETSNIIKDTLKHSVVICNEEWYVLNDKQLWNIQKEPSHYFIKEIYKYLDTGKDKLNFKINQAEGEMKKELAKEMEEWLKLYNAVTKSSYLSVLTKCLKTTLRDNEFADKLDANRGQLAFKNGIVDLETKTFRSGIMWCDYVTQTIPYDYEPSTFDFVKSKLKEILNNNDEHLEYFLNIIGYSFTGYADREKSIYFMIDKTEGGRGDNGKTFFFDILNDLLPCYVYKSKAELIANDNKKAHKQLARTKGKRLVWLEEMPKEKQTNAELLKYIGDGKPFENEVMFGTCEQINTMFKLFALSNHCPKIDPSETAVYNRYKQVSFNSHFDRTGDRTEPIPEELKFIADIHLSQNIKDNYYNEVFNLVIHYANQYLTNGMPKIPQQFLKDTKETQNKNDEFGEWFESNCNKKQGCNIALKELVKMSGFTDKQVKEGMERKGFKYNKDLSKGLGKDPATNKQYKGGYEGVEIMDIVEEEDDN